MITQDIIERVHTIMKDFTIAFIFGLFVSSYISDASAGGREDPLVKEVYKESISICTYKHPLMGNYIRILEGGKECPPIYYRKI